MAGLFLRNSWILAVFAGSLLTHHLLQQRTQSEMVSWAAAFAVLLTAGGSTSLLGG